MSSNDLIESVSPKSTRPSPFQHGNGQLCQQFDRIDSDGEKWTRSKLRLPANFTTLNNVKRKLSAIRPADFCSSDFSSALLWRSNLTEMVGTVGTHIQHFILRSVFEKGRGMWRLTHSSYHRCRRACEHLKGFRSQRDCIELSYLLSVE